MSITIAIVGTGNVAGHGVAQATQQLATFTVGLI